jgi:uncharacterized protein (TIGR02453 family)
MKKIIEFISELKLNNNKNWFDSHKSDYKSAQEEFNLFVEKLIIGISNFDPLVRGLTPKDCTYRIHRDVRFSKNKNPYKTHMGAYICPNGKKSGYAGYYFHIEPAGKDLIGGNLLSAGLYMPEPKILKSVREDISFNGKQYEKAIAKAKGFKLGDYNKLKRMPVGFSEDEEYAEYLKLKDIYLEKFISNNDILHKNFTDNVIKSFKITHDFTKLLNRAVEYAHEEM